MSPDLGRLQDILASSKTALAHIAGQTSDAFLGDIETQDAVLWRLAVIGEAANNMTDATREAIPLPWSQIIGMRHIAIHQYRKIEMTRVWSTVSDRVPELVTRVEDFLRGVP
jgi:uncharacterized protein with HEPN domain